MEFAGMFPLIDRDLPTVDEKILSYLNLRDLDRAKSVCKKWYAVLNTWVYAEIIAPPKSDTDLVMVRIQGKLYTQQIGSILNRS